MQGSESEDQDFKLKREGAFLSDLGGGEHSQQYYELEWTWERGIKGWRDERKTEGWRDERM